jgi:hypothetical protein
MSVFILQSKSSEELKSIIAQSSSRNEVLKMCGINILNNSCKKWLNLFIKENNIDISHFSQGKPAYKKYSYDEMKTYVDRNICWSDLLRDMGFKSFNNIKTLKKIVEYYKLDTSHFDAMAASVKNRTNKVHTKETMFCADSSASRHLVKSYIIKHNIIPYQCAECPITDTWNGKSIVLQLEHKNGINNDNRLENLCFLCPNCHSQTASYAGRNVLGSKRTKDGSFVNAS